MSSSIFEVRESESDSEKVLDFGLDTCEENGIMTSQLDGELPKDHTYNKEPDVLQEEDIKDSGISSNPPGEMDETVTPPRKPRATRAKSPKAVKSPTKAKTKSAVKKESPKKGRTKKDEVIEEANSTEGDVDTDDAEPKEQSKGAVKKNRKRKVEEKENVPDASQNAEGVEENDSEQPPKKKASTPSKAAKGKKDKVAITAGEGEEVSTDNLPKGWVRKTVTRKSGKSAGQIDIYIYSPDGFKFRSKPDIASYLVRTKSNLKLDAFDFSKKRATLDTSAKVTPTKTPKKKATKSKTPEKKKAASPKKSAKSPKLLVKIVSSKTSKSRAIKSAVEEKSRSAAKGKAASKKKKRS